MSNFDKAYESFIRYKSDYKEIIYSETDTRSKEIDFLMKEVLGWKEENIRREGKVNSGYFDYKISLNNFKFVVEAKKKSDLFKLPIKGRKHKLKSIEKLNPEVFLQIRNYILDSSLSFGIITNGLQFIIARFNNTDGNDWKENECVVFQNLEKIELHFADFYNLISYEAISVNGKFKIEKSTEFRSTIFETLKNKNNELVRNDFSSKLIPIIENIFNEIGKTNDETQTKLLKDCYIPSVDIHKHSEDLKNLFLDLPPTFDSKIQKVKNTTNLSEQIKENLFKNSNAPSPIILIGGKGAGKTTFIQYFFKLVLKEQELKNIPFVYIDFRNYTKQQIEDTKSIYSKILNSLINDYPLLKLAEFKIQKQIFSADIKQKTLGVWSIFNELPDKLESKISEFIEQQFDKPDIFLERISSYLIQFQRRNICIIFDNADQLEDDAQEKIFLLAQSLRGAIKSIVFVSLREGYYYQWRHKPPFDAFHSNVYHISAPPYNEVLNKRLEYAIDNVEFEPISTYTENKKVDFTDITLKRLFVILQRTLFSNSQSEIMKYLEQTSYPNIRKGLESMNNFLVSGHTKIDEYLTSQPFIPIWEFIKSISLNNRLYYSSQSSNIYNIFLPVNDSSDHFIKIKLLKHLNDFAKSSAYKEGYLQTQIIIDYFIKIGYSSEIIKLEIHLLFQYGLIETENLNSDTSKKFDVDKTDEITISNTGIYYFNEMFFRFHYLDLVLQDTPIYDEVWFQRIKENFTRSDNSGNRDIYLRKQTVDLFIKYLEYEERKGSTQNSFNQNEDEVQFYVTPYLLNYYNKGDNIRIEKLLNTISIKT